MIVLLALKLMLVPSLTAGITLSGRRWGPSVAGWLSAFPVVGGPILLFIAIEQGSAFASAAAVGTLSAVIAILVYATCYSWAATRLSWAGSLGCGMLGYFSAVALLDLLAPSLPVAAPLVLVGLTLAPRLFPRVGAPTRVFAAPRGDMIFRMLASAVLVLLVTTFAASMGPRMSGLLAMFPVLSTVLVVFSHHHSGREYAITLLRGMVFGWYAFAAFCLALALSLPALGVAPAFLLSLGCAGTVQLGTRAIMRRVPARS
ncbi:hypothetical protein GALL_106630 [mine drainage metagenome]|uniref:Uncharacterized protein n=1 Tax=mine drainage metagenome TaxID=410659 RepID=A0A1J5SZP6_9ZZZZ